MESRENRAIIPSKNKQILKQKSNSVPTVEPVISVETGEIKTIYEKKLCFIKNPSTYNSFKYPFKSSCFQNNLNVYNV